MTPRARTGLGVLGAALALGLAGDLLLRAVPWGLNVFLYTSALVASGAWLLRRGAVQTGPDTAWLGLTALLLGAAFVRRDATLLGVFDLMALAVTLALAAAAARGVAIRRLGPGAYVETGARTALALLTGGPRLLAADVPWRDLTERGRFARARGIAVGVLLALPLLVVFGGLFMAADAVFDRMITTALRFNLDTVASHIFLIGFWAALAAGYLRYVTLDSAPAPPPPAAAQSAAGLGVAPVATALVLLNALFLLFVGVQLRYLFGGAALVQETLGLTYAEYARRGFLELVTASGLVLPVLLGASWTLRAAAPAERRTFHRLAGLLLALLGVIMASGLERARLYVVAFGWSEIRLYATAGMLYFAGAFAWLAATVLREGGAERGHRFAFGAFVQGLAFLGALHVLNPDAFIVRRNVERPGTAGAFDAAYAASLSGDAVPVLLDALPRLSPHERCDVATALLHRWGEAVDADWRTWNWGRARARRLVAEHRPALAGACDPGLILKETR